VAALVIDEETIVMIMNAMKTLRRDTANHHDLIIPNTHRAALSFRGN
jgi:hypothetical protein